MAGTYTVKSGPLAGEYASYRQYVNARAFYQQTGEAPTASRAELRRERSERSLSDKASRVARRVATGDSLTSAARKERTTAKTVLKFDRKQQRGVFTGLGRRYDIGAVAHFTVLTADGKIHNGVPMDDQTASMIGSYWQDAHRAMSGKITDMSRYQITIADIFGREYTLMTDQDALVKLFLAQGDPMSGVKVNYERKRPTFK